MPAFTTTVDIPTSVTTTAENPHSTMTVKFTSTSSVTSLLSSFPVTRTTLYPTSSTTFTIPSSLSTSNPTTFSTASRPHTPSPGSTTTPSRVLTSLSSTSFETFTTSSTTTITATPTFTTTMDIPTSVTTTAENPTSTMTMKFTSTSSVTSLLSSFPVTTTTLYPTSSTNTFTIPSSVSTTNPTDFSTGSRPHTPSPGFITTPFRDPTLLLTTSIETFTTTSTTTTAITTSTMTTVSTPTSSVASLPSSSFTTTTLPYLSYTTTTPPSSLPLTTTTLYPSSSTTTYTIPSFLTTTNPVVFSTTSSPYSSSAANASEKKRGVALCFSNRLSFTDTKVIRDKEDLTTKIAKSHWRLNESLLSNESFCLDISTHVKSYFEFNKADDTTPAINWAAHKASVRGFLIQLSSRIKKAREELIVAKTRDYEALAARHKQSPSPDMLTKLEQARLELNICLTTKAEKQLRWANHRFFTWRDRPGSLLAHKLTPRYSHSALPKIRLSGGHIYKNPGKILQEFHKFYVDLYGQPQEAPSLSIKGFLNHQDRMVSLIIITKIFQNSWYHI
ncbi:mucin-5AC-like [Rana temporaria]|uniref:mucin-5AC-like n=1 Tax=Rana temporaria TaxID=8407 RepID=UPI001AACED4B|nr:mucin-5AC-like [Rana temporaria]